MAKTVSELLAQLQELTDAGHGEVYVETDDDGIRPREGIDGFEYLDEDDDRTEIVVVN